MTAGALNVTGETTLNGAVTAGALNVTGQSLLQLGVTGGSMFITGESILNGAVTAGALNVTGQSLLQLGVTAGSLYVTGNSILNGTITAGALLVTGTSVFNNGLTAGSIYVTGDSVLVGNVTMGAMFLSGGTVIYSGLTTGSLFVSGGTVLQAVTAASMMINGVDVTPNVGDICKEITFSALNNQTTPQDVVGFAFDNAVVRSFDAMVSVCILTSDNQHLYANYNLKGVQKNTFWVLNSTFIGDNTGVTFSINTTGQIQYTSTSIPNFVSDTLKIRALTTSVDV